ncbi:hypothetical protein LAZ67_2000218 [Cordylochernes scorpioides]|uniref:Uncharacterized protein n=1 Tax=Cordylochernes scorpioides TaxID=51811 RepID=A0ABY6K1N1_9ARAC|nr:hypothetical protein LAZ67_2000218 [Cordylochernes scorpioides]
MMMMSSDDPGGSSTGLLLQDSLVDHIGSSEAGFYGRELGSSTRENLMEVEMVEIEETHKKLIWMQHVKALNGQGNQTRLYRDKEIPTKSKTRKLANERTISTATRSSFRTRKLENEWTTSTATRGPPKTRKLENEWTISTATRSSFRTRKLENEWTTSTATRGPPKTRKLENEWTTSTATRGPPKTRKLENERTTSTATISSFRTRKLENEWTTSTATRGPPKTRKLENEWTTSTATRGPPKTRKLASNPERQSRDAKALRKVGAEFAEYRSKANCKRHSQQCLDPLKKDPTDFVRRFVTMDETWVHHYTPETKQQSNQWVEAGGSAQKKEKSITSARKLYLKIREKRPGLRKKKNHLSPGQRISKCVMAMGNLRGLRYDLLDHPPCSPDLATSDFHLFPHLKKFVSVKRFASNEEVERAVDEYFNNLPDSFSGRNTDIGDRLDHVEVKRDYVEK